MKQYYAWRNRTVELITAAAVMVLGGTAWAWSRYNDGCQDCHGSFKDGTSTRESIFPGDDKHKMHRDAAYMNTHCDLCHTDGDDHNPFIGSSDGRPGIPGVGCIGCHGRDYGESIGVTGAGLRAHHAANGVTRCLECHSDDPTPLPEDVPPPYYGTSETDADVPCNSPSGFNTRENWTLEEPILGLDNDGDGLYDGADPDCGESECANDGDCDDGVFCNGGESCVKGSCQAGTPVDCGDGVGCTDDSCDEATDSCDNVPSDADCDNGQFCDGAETCDAQLGCFSGGDPCSPGLFCNEDSDSCDALLGDIDIDGDVDLDDCAFFMHCVGGSDVATPPAGCTPEYFALADLDADGDVDLADAEVFQLAFGAAP